MARWSARPRRQVGRNDFRCLNLLVGAIVGLLRDFVLDGAREADLLDAGFWYWGELHAEIAEVARGSFKHRQPPAIRGSGYVVRSLEAALWALHRTTSFEEGALLAVNLGHDADTTGAVYGQLAGALYGEDGIPSRWREQLALHDLIRDLAVELAEHAA